MKIQIRNVKQTLWLLSLIVCVTTGLSVYACNGNRDSEKEANQEEPILGYWYSPQYFEHELTFVETDSVMGTLRINDDRECALCGPFPVSGTFTFNYPNVTAGDSLWQLSGVVGLADTVLEVSFVSTGHPLFFDLVDSTFTFYKR